MNLYHHIVRALDAVGESDLSDPPAHLGLRQWLVKASHEKRYKRCEPSMLHYNETFFHSHYGSADDVHIFGAWDDEDVELLLSRVVGRVAVARPAVGGLTAVKPYPMRVLCLWSTESWVPKMYALIPAYYDTPSYLQLVSYLRIRTVGIRDRNDTIVPDTIELLVEALSPVSVVVNSLCDAFRLLGKHEASIRAFITAEEPRR